MTLQDYKSCFSLSLKQFAENHSIDTGRIHHNRKYEKLENVSRVDVEEGVYFFYQDGHLMIIYVSEAALVTSLWREFKESEKFTRPDKIVRSRAGKTTNQEIYAQLGLTTSLSKDEVYFIEIYRPCSIEEYLNNIYLEPGPFIR